jgi:hypothetical protein
MCTLRFGRSVCASQYAKLVCIVFEHRGPASEPTPYVSEIWTDRPARVRSTYAVACGAAKLLKHQLALRAQGAP